MRQKPSLAMFWTLSCDADGTKPNGMDVDLFYFTFGNPSNRDDGRKGKDRRVLTLATESLGMEDTTQECDFFVSWVVLRPSVEQKSTCGFAGFYFGLGKFANFFRKTNLQKHFAGFCFGVEKVATFVYRVVCWFPLWPRRNCYFYLWNNFAGFCFRLNKPATSIRLKFLSSFYFSLNKFATFTYRKILLVSTLVRANLRLVNIVLPRKQRDHAVVVKW